ncbi:YetF domain-containing protein [Halothermothrix orenii]|uniref:Predicted membrane protein n=1 Tax=Halothermothrix orenii (strain H 168 / OCM 544 / DSM 9562) TaxID=373903 RepID=B8D0L6_HALOH|nr:DUF421 domain-containing protein [Halothermothrix orenii]ACL70952.1 predicted membrane protein [Halothermothrix orenii H 168]
MLIVIARTLILYILVLLVLRLTGKRQIGELQPFEFATTIMVSALAAIPMEDIEIPLLYSIFPILLILSFQVITSILSMKNTRIRSFICGKPSILIENGKLVESELRHLRMNINDLLEQLRVKGFYSIEDVEFAIMETSGDLSVIPKSQKRPVTPEDLNLPTGYEAPPHPLIIDGEVQKHNLRKIGLDKEWLMNELKKFNLNRPEDVFFAALSSDGNLIYQKKNEGLHK